MLKYLTKYKGKSQKANNNFYSIFVQNLSLMRFLQVFAKWQFWVSILMMVVLIYGLYHFTFRVWLDAYTNHNEEIAIPDLSKMKIQEATKHLDELGLLYEIDSVKYDSTKEAYAVLEFFPQAGFKVKEGRRIFIKSNPKTWRPVNLPDIVGKSKRLAFTQLKIAGLVVGDTIYEPDIAKDAVLRVLFQGKQISAGTQLPRFAKIDLVLGKGLEYGVRTPSLLGMTLGEAESSILANRFELGQVIVQGVVSDSLKLKVFYQYPLAGDNYDQGLPVDLWVSELETQNLRDLIKELDKQYRNFSENDSIAAAKYEEELRRAGTPLPKKQNENTPEIPNPQKQPQKQPDGVQFD